MLRELERDVLRLEGADFGPLDQQVLPGEHLAERGAQDLVALERAQRLAERGGQPADAAALPLGLGERVRIGQRGLARVELARDAVEAGGEKTAEGQIGIVRWIAGLQLDSSTPSRARGGPKARGRRDELAILITGRFWNAQFEFWAHNRLARTAGLPDAIIDALAEGRRPSPMSDDEQIVYDFCTEMFHDKAVSDVAFKAVVGRFGEQVVSP